MNAPLTKPGKPRKWPDKIRIICSIFGGIILPGPAADQIFPGRLTMLEKLKYSKKNCSTKSHFQLVCNNLPGRSGTSLFWEDYLNGS
jgi:hypothetical protein